MKKLFALLILGATPYLCAMDSATINESKIVDLSFIPTSDKSKEEIYTVLLENGTWITAAKVVKGPEAGAIDCFSWSYGGDGDRANISYVSNDWYERLKSLYKKQRNITEKDSQ